MKCSRCATKYPMSKLTVIGEGWEERWLCEKCLKEHIEVGEV